MRAAKSASSRQPRSSRAIWTQGGGIVVLHAEKLEAEGQKEGIAGEADEGGEHFAACPGQCVAAVEQQVFCQVAVDERVAIDLEEIFEHPKAQDEAGGKGERAAERAELSKRRGLEAAGAAASIDSREWLPYDS